MRSSVHRPTPATNVYRPGRRWRVFLIAFAAILAPMLLWTLASPMMSIPDEPAHAIRAAAVVRGQIETGPWSKIKSQAAVEVPQYIAHTPALTCYAFQPTTPAGCMRELKGDPDKIVTSGTTAGLNSPSYYAIVGLPTLVMNGNSALYAMRGVNAVLCAAALAIMVMQLLQLARARWALLATFVAVTPMVVYLGGAINPNGLEIAAAGALFATLVVTLRTEASRLIVWERAALIIVLTGLLVSTRSIALLWTLIMVGAALAFADRHVLRGLVRKPAAWLSIGLTGVVAVLTVLWYLSPVKLAGIPGPRAGDSRKDELVRMLYATFDFSDGLVGVFGWGDTRSPTFSVIVWSFAIVALLMAAFIWGSKRGRFAVLGLGVMMVLVPAITQTLLITNVGFIWQGRYMLALLLVLLVACGLAIDDSELSPTLSLPLRRFVLATVVLLGVAQVFSFFATLRRYVIGMGTGVEDMWMAPMWQPPLTWQVLTALLALVVAATAVLVYRVARASGPDIDADPKDTSNAVPSTDFPSADVKDDTRTLEAQVSVPEAARVD